MEVVEGTVFAGYRVERRLGSGGMGTVFRVQHPRLPRKDALKVLAEKWSDSAESRARFLREAEIAARLQHPNLVAVRDRGEQDDRLWIAMQYVEGSDVAELIRRSPGGIEPARATEIVGQAAEGLDALHGAGLLHRDVKPANILVAARPDGADRVLVTDFGIAAFADGVTSGVPATLNYAAPEQLGGGSVDLRADVYALGCTLYHMLTGSVPFPRDNPGAVVYAHLRDAPPRPSRENPQVPVGFDAVVAKAMAKDPDSRYPGCGALAAAARAAAAGTGDEVPAARTRDRLVVVAAALLLVAACVASAFVWFGDNGSVAPPTAENARNPRAVNTAEWGAFAYIVQTFPELLPPSPLASGYQDVAVCTPMDGSRTTVSHDAAPALGELFCVGTGDPVLSMRVRCNADRSPIFPDTFYPRVEGNERWKRASGSGNLNWGTEPDFDGLIVGVLDVYFDGAARNFCMVRVRGGGSGDELYRQWWPDAPL